MIEVIAERIAVKLKEANEEQTTSVAIMKFALIGILSTIFSFALALLIGLITGKFLETLVVFFSFALLRYITGGIHLKSSFACMLASALVLALLPHIPVNTMTNYILIAISLILVGLFAPSNIRGAAKISEKYFPVLRVIGLMIVSTNLFFLIPEVTLAFTIQALSLIPYKGGEKDET